MALDPVPWAVGGGAEHSPEVLRLLAYAATGGTEGVTGPTDLLVRQLATAGTSIRVAPGSATILNRYAGGSQQSYMARAATETTLAVPATGSQAGRSDLVVLRIDDPQYGGVQPSDPKVGPYVRVALISGVSASTTSLPGSVAYPAIVLARIDIPANTGTIEQGMIVDLRKVARPRRTRDLYNTQPTSTSTIASAAWTDWTPQANRDLLIPSWATQVKVIGHLSAVAPATASTKGIARFAFGAQAGQQIYFDLDTSTRQTLLVSDTLPVASNLRGTVQRLKLQAARTTGAGNIITDAYSTIVWDVEFLEVASAD